MPFDIGQLVALRADRGHKGTIIAVLGKIGELNRYRVFHSAKESREYIEDQLIPEGDGALADHVAVLISANNLLETDLFRARLTAARLSNPQLDSIYALHAARIQFIPFQFKPLLRFLRADTPRLLIADEVGVGKTIEAGLILNELSARHRLKNVLVVCPKALTTKWQSELRRFDHKFQILDSRALKYCLQETFRDGVWPAEYRRAIVHLELLRRPDYLFGTKSRPATPLSAADTALVRACQAGLPRCRRPYQALADSLGWQEAQVIERLQHMLAHGIIRRIGAAPNHYAIGYTANGMAVFDIDDAHIDACGERLGALAQVSHCYHRPRQPGWPYNLFAMCHGGDRDAVRADVALLREQLGSACRGHDVLFSTAMLKKSGVRI